MQYFTPEQYAAMEAARRASTPKRMRCTKYQLVTCLGAHFPELRDSLRENYKNNADLQFFWNTVNDLDRQDSMFQHFVSTLGITDAQLDAIFEKIEGAEPAATNG